MNFQEYLEEKRTLYKEFSQCVAAILESAMSNTGRSAGVLQIQHRAKGVEFLSKKLKERNLYHSDSIELGIKDLAGCRVIFYQNDDLNTFLQSNLIEENFDIDDVKIHHPDGEARLVNELYMGNHYVVMLKSSRTDLSEYSKFTGLRCEIQIQTLLNHAWSEISHDITYKKPGSKGFGDRKMEQIEARLVSIMKDYLQPAGYELQKVKHDFSQIESGRKIFDQDLKQAIKEIADINELHNLLERYKNYVLPNYSDHTVYADDIYTLVEKSLERSRRLGTSPIETPLGSFNDKEYKDILSLCLDILGFALYVDLDRTFALIGEICRTHHRPAEQDLICEFAKHLAGYNYEVVRYHGFIAQKKLLDTLSAKSDEQLLEISRYVITSSEAILTPSIGKSDWIHDQVTLSTINLLGSEELASIRSGVLKLLKRLTHCGERTTRESAFSAMEKATRTPNMDSYGDELMEIILSDTNSLISAYIDEIDRQDFQAMEAREERILFFYRRAQKILETENYSKEVIKVAGKTISLVNEHRDKLGIIPNYERYKILVGFHSVLAEEWDRGKLGWQEKGEYRKRQSELFVESIDENNVEEWIDFFACCVKTDSSDLATSKYLSEFLRLFARQKPDLAKYALDQERSGLNKFLHHLLLGFADAGRIDLFEEVVDFYVAKGEYICECIRPFTLLELSSRDLLHRAKDRALELENRSAIYQVVVAAILGLNTYREELDSLFLPAINKLTELSDAGWVGEAYSRKETIELLRTLDRDISRIILQNLVSLRDIDLHAEAIIEPIAENHPELVVNFFGERLGVEREKESGDRYNAIPYDFQKLSGALSKQPELLVDSIFSCFQKSPRLFQFHWANLVSNAFPSFDSKLEEKLIQLVQTRGDSEIEFVISILRNYEGETFLHNVCWEIVIAVDGQERYSNEVEIILESSGVLIGEFGFVERCKQKKEEIEYWLNDSGTVIQEFTRKYIKSLDRQRVAAQRHAEEDLELRKHQYGSSF